MAKRGIVRRCVCRSFALMVLSAQCLLLGLGCASDPPAADPLAGANCDFEIHWPPRDPGETAKTTQRPLLVGQLAITETLTAADRSALQIRLTITRPSGEAEREYWNAQLAFADLPWMDEVRVWDATGKWQWPNLPYLLRRPGQERVERYGGVDPAKQVDNDFAAVLIREFDAAGVQSPETQETPLVSAEWHPAASAESDIQSVVHVARSDPLVVHVGGEPHPAHGKLKIWLIYADFLNSRPPRSWPRQREWAGGILAYWEVDWSRQPGGPCRGTVQIKRPPESTGFDWQQWAEKDNATARLNDAVE